MLRTRTVKDSSTADGFTLMELLVALVVLGLLATVAVPSYLNHRKGAYDVGVKSDLRHVAEAQESWISDSQIWRGTRSRPVLLAHGAAFTPSNVIQVGRIANGYCLRGFNPDGWANGATGGGYFFYDSMAGGLQPGRAMVPLVGGACAMVPAGGWEDLTDDLDENPINPTPTPPPTSTPPIGVPPVNDKCAGAIQLSQPLQAITEFVSPVVDPTLATADSLGAASLYFSHVTPTAAYETIEVRSPEGGSALSGLRTLLVVKGDCGGTLGLLSILETVGLSEGEQPGVTFKAEAGQTYYVVVVGALGNYQVAVERSDVPARADNFTSAEQISVLPGQTTSQDYSFSTLFATQEVLEVPLMNSSVWHKVTTGVQLNLFNLPQYTFTTLPPTTGKRPIGLHTIEVFTAPVSAGLPGVPIASKTGLLPLSVDFQGASLGQNVMVRVRSLTGVISGDYRVSLSRGSA